jgi:hypothetical protein
MSIPGMRKSTKETCWYFLYQGDLVAHVLVHVDDYLCGCNQPAWFTWFVKYFGDTYEINNLGCLTQIVGMGATQTSDCITLSRSHQINQSIQRFHLGDATLSASLCLLVPSKLRCRNPQIRTSRSWHSWVRCVIMLVQHILTSS